MEIYYI